MHSVVTLPNFIRSAQDLKISQSEIDEIIDYFSLNPQSGDLIKGAHGIRKVRIPRKDSGKSGGYRVLTLYGGVDIPVFLIDIYAKNKKENISQEEKRSFAKLAIMIKNNYK